MMKVLNYTREKTLTAKKRKNMGSNKKSLISHTATLDLSSSNPGYAAGFQRFREMNLT